MTRYVPVVATAIDAETGEVINFVLGEVVEVGSKVDEDGYRRLKVRVNGMHEQVVSYNANAGDFRPGEKRPIVVKPTTTNGTPFLQVTHIELHQVAPCAVIPVQAV